MKNLINSFQKFIKIPNHTIAPLDGLRTMAIALVFLTHSAQHFESTTGQHLSMFNLPFILSGWIGVELFFVLSGYLIGLSLWKSIAENQTLDIVIFFIKRSLRIWPIYFFYLFLFSYVLKMRLGSGNSLWPEFVFLSNYFGESGIKGSWSLAIEEQFYIFAPILLLIFRKNDLGFHRKIIVGLLIFAPIARLLQLYFVVGNLNPPVRDIIDHLYYPFHTDYDGLLMGLLFSNIMTDYPEKLILFLNKYKSWVLLILPIAVARYFFLNLFNYSLLAIIFSFFLWTCLHKNNIIIKVLSWKYWHYTSKLSFGIYLSHRVVLQICSKYLNNSAIPAELLYSLYTFITALLCLILTFVTFILIESPFLTLRSKLLNKAKVANIGAFQ